MILRLPIDTKAVIPISGNVPPLRGIYAIYRLSWVGDITRLPRNARAGGFQRNSAYTGCYDNPVLLLLFLLPRVTSFILLESRPLLTFPVSSNVPPVLASTSYAPAFVHDDLTSDRITVILLPRSSKRILRVTHIYDRLRDTISRTFLLPKLSHSLSY